MTGQGRVSWLALLMLVAVPAGAAAQSTLMQAKTSGGAEVATIRTDSMRLLVPLRVLGTGLRAGFLAADDSLRVDGEGSVLATGTYSSTVSPPASGAGMRMMWYPEKGAFRAGHVNGTQWDAGNTGAYSAAFGDGATASGEYTFAVGFQTVAANQASFAAGSYATATGGGSVATGVSTTASEAYAFAGGYSTTASGAYSVAMGSNTVASGLLSTAFGSNATAQAENSFVIGRNNVVEGSSTIWVASDPLFVVGNGTSTTPSNALTLYKDGNLTIAGALTEYSDARLKEDIEPLKGVLERVMRLTPIRYRFRPGMGHPSGEQIGLTAQQVEPLFPDLVARNGDGYLSLSYANLSAVLVKAVQEQQAEIEAVRGQQAEVGPLKAQIRALRQRNNQLQSDLAALRAKQSEILRRLRALETAAGG